ncbi:transposase [uncultured Desulfobacter sp.]|uniref:IS91 family transposase n=1 Tax=uncultured Desulfobacter sp. TaxID=240139 RepID=UPI0029F50726|nr:transposase [uncultured Desulfobacter sp.]
MLHTWGGKLWLHPHIHFIVTAGGVNTRGEWMEPKYSSTFLFPVRALSNVFRAKFLNGLITAQGQGLLKLPGDLAQFSSPDAFRQWLFHTVPRDWVVYSKPPFSGPEDVVRYIGRYTHSTAISNNRIISIEDDVVTFWFKNTRKNSRWETTTLPVMEFINRFLIHVLPKHFHRIRYYGFLANGKAGKQIASIRRALGSRIDASPETKQHIEQVYRCPACGNGTMMTILVLDGYGNIVKEVLPVADTQQILIAEGSP